MGGTVMSGKTFRGKAFLPLAKIAEMVYSVQGSFLYADWVGAKEVVR